MAGPIRSLWNLLGIMSDRKSVPICIVCISMGVLYGVCYVVFTTELASLQAAFLISDPVKQFRALVLSGVVVLGGALAAALMLYTGDLLINVAWKRRLSEYISERYFKARIAFQMSQIDGRITDADQRIAADAIALCAQLKTVLIGAPMFLGFIPLAASSISFGVSLVQQVGYTALLMSLALCFAFLVINYFLMKRPQALSKLNTNTTGVYRFMQTYIRLQSESIALLGGHDREHQRTQQLMDKMTEQTSAEALSDIALNTNSNLFYWGVGTASAVIPFWCMKNVPIDPEKYSEVFLTASGYISSMLYQLAVFALLSRDFSQLLALAQRIDELIFVLNDLVARQNDSDMNSIATESQCLLDTDEISFEQVVLRTPAGRLLFPNGISFSVKNGGRQNVLIMGPNGIGKSSLFRALGDLWPVESGSIRKPLDRNSIFFVPQRPFLSYGTLREQIAYPSDGSDLDDKSARVLLETVRLSRFSQDLDRVAMWPEILSGGEQQRLGIARLLYHRPRFAILDESTSAMDEQTEIYVYDLLARTGTGLLSIGHRSTIRQFHHVIIKIDDDGHWSSNLTAVEKGKHVPV